MKRNYYRLYLTIVLIGLLALSLLGFAGCISSSSSSSQSQYYNAGNANLSVTGAQFDQYELFRFDTSPLRLRWHFPAQQTL